MKKRVWVLLFLLAAIAVSAQESGIPRYSDIPLDNIHIIRLQEASLALGNNVSAMEGMLKEFKDEQNAQVADLRRSVDSMQQSLSAAVADLQDAIEEIRTGPDVQFATPTEYKMPAYLIALLGGNIFLLVLIIIMLFWLREQYYVHRETHKKDHIHPAPDELVAYVKHALEHKRKVPDLRLELANKGWTPSIIEHAVHAAKEK